MLRTLGAMDKRLSAAVLAALAAVLLVLNVVVDDAGTLFLLLAVACGLSAAFLFASGRTRSG